MSIYLEMVTTSVRPVIAFVETVQTIEEAEITFVKRVPVFSRTITTSVD